MSQNFEAPQSQPYEHYETPVNHGPGHRVNQSWPAPAQPTHPAYRVTPSQPAGGWTWVWVVLAVIGPFLAVAALIWEHNHL